MPCRHLGRGSAAQVKEREAKWWRQKRGLQVDRKYDAEPDRIMPQQDERRCHQGKDDHGNFNEIQEEPHEKNNHHRDEKRICCTSGQVFEPVRNAVFPAEADEDETEHARCEDRREDHRGHRHGRGGSVMDNAFAKNIAQRGKNAQRTDDREDDVDATRRIGPKPKVTALQPDRESPRRDGQQDQGSRSRND